MTGMFNKIGINSTAFPSLSPEQLVEAMVKLGYRGIEWRVAETNELNPNISWNAVSNNRCTVQPNLKSIEQITDLCKQANIEIFGLSPYIPVGDKNYALKMLDLAHVANHARVRIWAPFNGNGSTYQERYYQFRKFIDELLMRAEELNVQLALEIHQRTICSSPSFAVRVAEHYPHNLLGVIYDMGNLAIEGREDVQLSLDLIGKHLTHVQIKNVGYRPLAENEGWAWYWETIENGVLPIPKMLSTVIKNNFNDWLSIEDFSSQRSDLEKLKHNIELIRSYLDGDFYAIEKELVAHAK